MSTQNSRCRVTGPAAVGPSVTPTSVTLAEPNLPLCHKKSQSERRRAADGEWRRATEREAARLGQARVRLTLLAALALASDAGQGGNVLPGLNSCGRSFADTYQALNHGAHGAA